METSRPGRGEIFWILLIVALTLGLRLGTFFHVYTIDPRRMLQDDSPTYELPAKALLQTGRFATGPETPDRPELMRTPGYPLFIAAVYGVFGESRCILIVVQILMSVATLGMTWFLARRWFGPRPALAAALILALDPVSFLYSQLMLTETLFTFLLVLCCGAAARACFAERRAWAWALAAGLLIAAATHVRPVAYFLVFPMAVLLGAIRRSHGERWKAVASVLGCLVLPWAALVVGWQVRNRIVGGTSEFSTIQSYNLLYYRGAGIVQRLDGVSFEQAQETLRRRQPEMSTWPLAERSTYYRREALRLFRQHPGLLLRTTLEGMARMMLGPGSGSLGKYFRPDGRAILESGGWLYLIVLYGGIALYFGRYRKKWKTRGAIHALLWITLLYFVFISAGPEAYSRFRVPIMPLLSIYAGLGLAAWRAPRDAD